MQISKKVVVLGHFGVGKTSLIRRAVDDSFSDNYEVSIGVHITKKIVDIKPNTSVSLILWDLEGTTDLTQIRTSYLLGTHAIIYVFDLLRPSTFLNLPTDISIINDRIPDVPIHVVGNKVDLMASEDLSKILENHEISLDYLTSAKTGDKVDELFEQLAKTLVTDAQTTQRRI